MRIITELCYIKCGRTVLCVFFESVMNKSVVLVGSWEIVNVKLEGMLNQYILHICQTVV